MDLNRDPAAVRLKQQCEHGALLLLHYTSTTDQQSQQMAIRNQFQPVCRCNVRSETIAIELQGTDST